MKHIFKKVLLSLALVAVLTISAFAINIDLVEADISGDKLTMIVGLSDTTGDEFVSIALYDENGRMTDYYPMSTPIYDYEYVMFFPNWDTSSVTAKVFAMADKTSIEPLTESMEISLPIKQPLQANEIIIVTPDNNGYILQTGPWTPEAGRQTFVNVWVDGEVKYVPVNTEADVMYPLTAYNVDKYVGKLATYKVDKDGLYTITPIADFQDEDGYELGLPAIRDVDFTDKEDEKLQGQFTALENGYLKKYMGDRFQLLDQYLYGSKLKDNDGKNLPDLIIDENTVIIIRNEYTSGSKIKVDFVELNASTLTNHVEQELTNIQFVLTNNTGAYADAAEKLVVLYAETVEDEKLSIASEAVYEEIVEKDDRIISSMSLTRNTDSKFVYSYTVINPYTGLTENFLGTHTEKKAADASSPYALGDVVKVEAGQIEDANTDARIANISDARANLYWVLDCDNDELLIGEIPADGSEPTTAYRINVTDATVLMIGKQVQSGENMYRYANDGHVVGTLETLADNVYGNATNYKAVSSSYWDENDKLVKAYGQYVKVYLNIDWENADHSANGNGVHGKATYIVAVANNKEELKYCDTENPVKA